MENKNKHNFSAKGVVAFLVFWLLVGSLLLAYQTCTSAIEPMPTAPSNPYGDIVNGLNISQTDIIYIRAVFNVQYDSGGFDHLYPVALYVNSDGTIRVAFWPNTPETSSTNALPYYSYDGAGQFNGVNTSSAIRYQMTEYGFSNLYTGSFPSTIATENMLSYRNSAGEWVDNPDAFGGSSTNNTRVTLAFNRWQDWYNQFPPESGGGGPQVIVNELDIGSIIASLPQAARNILDSTFGFELFGINIAATLTAVLLVTIVAFVVKWLMSR